MHRVLVENLLYRLLFALAVGIEFEVAFNAVTKLLDEISLESGQVFLVRVVTVGIDASGVAVVDSG